MCHAALVRAELMPIYEFECTNEDCEANLRYEKEFSINEPHDPKCQFCHSSMQKIYSVPNIQFKGSGFYSTDN
jgi:putative FmdB family regulatory protein